MRDPDGIDVVDPADADGESEASVLLQSAAFGTLPHLERMPPPQSAHQWWLSAVTLGGQGFYARARASLDEVDRRTSVSGSDRDRILASLSASTRASFLRQRGRHALASIHDGRALALVSDVPDAVDAACDALTGLAADALGCGRLALGWQLLHVCESRSRSVGSVGSVGDHVRQEIRLQWVSAELSLAGGDFDRATGHARRAVSLCGGFTSIRHRVKSELLMCAALTGTDVDGAVAGARIVLDQCRRYELLPLAWASSMLIEGVTGVSTTPSARDFGIVIAGRGGSLRPM